MERDAIQVKPGWEYDHYFPKAKGGTVSVKSGATLEDTLKLIPKIVSISIPQGKRFANEVIKGSSLEDTCRRLWTFTYGHIAYKKDQAFKEQVRDIARIWNDRHNIDPKTGKQSGCDCDCYTSWCSAILCALDYGKHLYMRITKYPDPENPSKPASEISFSHIYPIIKLPNGKQITIDCVVHQFNYEEPYLEKRDIKMDLEYLNGVPSSGSIGYADNYDLMGFMDEQQALQELGKIFKKKGGAKKAPAAGTSHQKKKGAFLKKVGKVAGKGLHIANRINPATALLRGGILASMKINFMKIGSGLRYTYLTDEQARSKGADMNKFHKLKQVREKLDKIFFGAGGKPENLRKAILTGHGNKDKAVPLSGFGYIARNTDHLHEDMGLSQLLGPELYHSEFVDGMDGFQGFAGLGELGEPATAASIAAATTVLTTIAALIKSVGSIFPKKAGAAAAKGGAASGDDPSDSGSTDPGSADDNSQSNSADPSGDDSQSDPPPGADPSADPSTDDNAAPPADEDHEDASSGGDETPGDDGSDPPPSDEGVTNGSASKSKPLPATTGDGGANKSLLPTTTAKTTPTKVSFWESNKKWIKPVGITAGSLALIALMYKLLKPKPKAYPVNGLSRKRRSKPKATMLDGIKSKPKKGGAKPHKKKAKKKKQVITLL